MQYGFTLPFNKINSNEILQKKYLNKYTPMLIDELMMLIDEREDAFLILDTKVSHLSILEEIANIAKINFPRLRGRLIPHISGPKEYIILSKLNFYVDYIIASYRSNLTFDQILDFVRKSGIKAVMMHHKDYRDGYEKKLNFFDSMLYVHGLDDYALISKFRSIRVGVYIDSDFPQNFYK